MAVLSIGGAIAFHPSRERLFATPLHAEQLSEVEERLASWNVAFTPTADNVVVDARRRNDVLLRLSLSGVPHAHAETSGEALANVGVLTPQAVIDAQTRAGLAGDIEAGLRGIEGLDDARVIVAPAKSAEFADESAREASASVRVRLRTGAQLSREAIAGIRAFVAAGVPGLTPSRVTLLDDRGVALNESDGGGDEAADVQRSLQSALDGAFGDGATIVRVRAEYRGDRRSERDVARTPVDGNAIAHAARNESFDDGGKRYRRHEETDDRGSETREFVSETDRGDLKRLSTAVFVDVARGLEPAKVRDLAAATVGYDASRGDSLVVQAVDFRRERAARKDVWWLLYGAIVPAAPMLIVTLGRLRRSPDSSGPLRIARPNVDRARVGQPDDESRCRFRSQPRAQRARARTSSRRRGHHQRPAGRHRRCGLWICIRHTNAKRSSNGCSVRIRRCSPMPKNCCAAMPEGFVPLEVALRRTPGDETATLQNDRAFETPANASASRYAGRRRRARRRCTCRACGAFTPRLRTRSTPASTICCAISLARCSDANSCWRRPTLQTSPRSVAALRGRFAGTSARAPRRDGGADRFKSAGRCGLRTEARGRHGRSTCRQHRCEVRNAARERARIPARRLKR